MAGPLGWPPLISGRLHVPRPRTTSSCACARRPSPIDMHRQPAAAQTRGTRDLALPDPPGASPCPNARRQTTTGAHSTIGRRTTSSESAPTCTPRSGRRPGFSWPASSPTRPPSRTSGSSMAIFAPLPAGARLIIMHGNGIESARLRNGLGMDIYFADPYSS